MDSFQPFRLILASSSPARRELLASHGYEFEVRPPQIEEPTEAGHGDPRSYVQEIAWMKAAAVAATVDDGFILAADTVGWCDGKPVLKPKDGADARRILRILGGRAHELWTGVCLWRKSDDLQLEFQEMTRVHMKAMNDAELDEYIRAGDWVGASGAYKIREKDDPLLTIDGSLSNVIGLPMERFLACLPITLRGHSTKGPAAGRPKE